MINGLKVKEMTEFEKFRSIGILKGDIGSRRARLFDYCKRAVFEKGELIMEEGETRNSMFFFIEGGGRWFPMSSP